jgi:large subunit ribosomal protein L5
MTRLRDKYRKEVVPELVRKFKYKNNLQVPRLEKIVINMGIGEATREPKLLEDAAGELALITGQRPALTRSKKSISNFKLRTGIAIGCRVTLRGNRMYEFLDRLVNVALPRIRDFRGLSPKSFDGSGNYALGLSEQVVFPELELDKIKRVQGMDIIMVTNSDSDEEARELLGLLGVPFARK